MLKIECPWCGPRDEIEFRYGGQSHIERPVPAQAVDDDRWGRYLYFRDNPKGDHAERWAHIHGCGQWFNLIRNTVTHEIKAVYAMGEPRPEAAR